MCNQKSSNAPPCRYLSLQISKRYLKPYKPIKVHSWKLSEAPARIHAFHPHPIGTQSHEQRLGLGFRGMLPWNAVFLSRCACTNDNKSTNMKTRNINNNQRTNRHIQYVDAHAHLFRICCTSVEKLPVFEFNLSKSSQLFLTKNRAFANKVQSNEQTKTIKHIMQK